MLSEVFYWILNMSITASLIGLALLLLRRVGKIPRFVIYLLWNPVLIRLLLPIGISSRYSFMNLFSRTLAKPVALEGFSGTDVTMTNYVRAAEEYFPINYRTALLERIFRVSSIIWLVGMVAAAVIFMLSYAAASKAVKRTLKPAGGYFLSSLAATPFVYGIFRPKIILPPDLEQDHARYVLAHEKIHIRRRDNLWRMTALLAACIHWFNPLIWYLLKSFYNDMEFACDEKAVKALTPDERKEYASVMLKFAAKRTPAVCSSFGGSVVRKRIEYVLNYRSMSLIASLCLSVFIIAMVVVLLTNPSP
jgi:beta-lactamase regulating signal transducer with metallopeptidase domain